MGRDVWLPSKKQEGGEWLKAQKGRELACWDRAESQGVPSESHPPKNNPQVPNTK